MIKRKLALGALFLINVSIGLMAAAPDQLAIKIKADPDGVATVEMLWPSSFTNSLDLFTATNLVDPDWKLVWADAGTEGVNSLVWSNYMTSDVQYFQAATDHSSDTDALSDARELLVYNTLINVADTDGDGIDDGDEVFADGTHGDSDGFLTDPLSPDKVDFVLPDLYIAAPTTNLHGFAAFNPPITNSLVPVNAPAIGEWTRSNNPGDTMALAGEFDGTATHFLFYGESSSGRKIAEGKIQRLAGRLAAVTLPESLPEDEVYFLWPSDSNGWGKPVAINRAEAWWLGPDSIATGGAFTIFGRDLILGAGACSLYIEELDQWITSTTSTAYKADFTFPTFATNGTYTCWAHNGHGGVYGFSRPLEISLRAASGWDNNPATWIVVTDAPYNAVGDGVSDNYAAFYDAFDDAEGSPWSTIYIPAGTYAFSKRLVTLCSKVRVMGAGMGQTILRDQANIGSLGETMFLAFRKSTTDDTEFHNLTFKHGEFHTRGTLLDLDGENMLFSNVRFDQSAVPYSVGSVSEKCMIDASNTRNVRFESCEFLLSGPLNLKDAEKILFTNCRFEGLNDIGYMTSIASANGLSFEKCTATHFDRRNANDGHGWAQGRFIYGSGGLGGIQNIHYANNQTLDLFVRPGYTNNQNTGEHFMHEYGETRWCGSPVSVSSNSFSVDRLYPDDIGQQLMVKTPTVQTQTIAHVDMASATVFIEGEWEGYPDPDHDPVTVKMDHEEREKTLLYVTKRSVSNNSAVMEKLYPSYVGETAAVIEGRGFGQHRTIIDYDYDNRTFTLDEPWRINPDGNSVLAVGYFAARHVVHNNLFDADPIVLEDNTRAATAVQPFNGQFDLVVDGNRFHEMRKGVALWGMDAVMPSKETAMEPSYFNVIKNNIASNCTHAFEIIVADWGLDPLSFEPTLACNVWRNNTILDAVSDAFHYRHHHAGDMPIELGIFDGNYTEGDYPVQDIDGLNDQVWVGNEFTGSGTGISIADGHVPALRGNLWSGFSANYEGAVSGGVLELPVRRVETVAAMMSVPIWNSGTAPLNWTAIESSSWVDLFQAGGIVSGENDIGSLPFSIDLAAASGEALITVIANSQTQTVTVVAQ